MDGSGFDEQLARLDKIADLADRFVLVRLTDARRADLNLFDFDFDLAWAGLFVTADGQVLGRFGGRDAAAAEKYHSLAGLRHAMSRALAAHARAPRPEAKEERPPRTVEDYPAAKRLRSASCVHCHQVAEVRREDAQAAGRWKTDDVWVYPPPENVGLSVDPDRGDRVTAVAPDSPAARAGLRVRDELVSVNGLPVASFADVQYALHRAPAKGEVAVAWTRDGERRTGTLALAEGWRKADISWRASTRSLGPAPPVHGEDLGVVEKRRLGLGPKALAVRQGNFVPRVAQQAGLRQGDVIVGVDDQAPELTAAQLGVHLRMSYKPGDRVTFTVLRGGERLRIALTLPERGP